VPRKTEASAPTGSDFPCACASARRAARAVTQLYDTHLRAAGIEGTQFALLSVLGSIGPCSQAAIGQRFLLDKTTLSRNLTLLKKRGWIDAARAEDGRGRRITLSAAGRRRLEAARPAWRRAQAQLRASMTAGEWNTMWKAFHIVTHAAQSARDRV
jgi:DNA-binding MarR family transcriptional regulator